MDIGQLQPLILDPFQQLGNVRAAFFDCMEIRLPVAAKVFFAFKDSGNSSKGMGWSVVISIIDWPSVRS